MTITDDIYGHLLAYQETDEFRAVEAQEREAFNVSQRPTRLKAQTIYRKKYPQASKLRAAAARQKTDLYEQQHGLCGLCGEQLDGDYVVDHKKPIVAGGTNEGDNLHVVHQRCNLVKGKRIVKRWS